MITVQNYDTQTSGLDKSNWPEALQEGHDFFLESAEYYKVEKDIRDTIDLYLQKLNEYVQSGNDKRGTVEKQVRKKSKTIQKTETQSGKQVSYLQEEVNFIKRFIGFHNKEKEMSAILAFIKSLQKAILQKLVRKTSPYASDIKTIQDKLVTLYNSQKKEGAVRISIKDADLARYVGIAGGESVYKSVGLIKRFIGFQGKRLDNIKKESFLKSIQKATITDDDPYFNKVQAIVDVLKTTKEGKVKVSDQELNGLNGILKGCGCKGLGNIYNTFDKELRKCKSKKYSDAPGKGACSHHKGVRKVKCKELNGIMTAQQVANMEYEKLQLTGKWKELIGQPAMNFDMMVFGQPGSGKSTFLISFAHYLASNFGSVLYVSGEEFNSAPLTEKIKQLPSIPSNLHFSQDLRNVNLKNYRFVILDSITDLGIDLEAYKIIREKNPDTAFILILQTTKDGKFKGGKEWEHEVEIAGEVDNGVISIYKNRYGIKGSLNFFKS